MYSKREKTFMGIWFLSLMGLFMTTYAYEPIDTYNYTNHIVVSEYITSNNVVADSMIADSIIDTVVIVEDFADKQVDFGEYDISVIHDESVLLKIEPEVVLYNEMNDPDMLAYNNQSE